MKRDGIQFMRTANFYHIWVKNRRKEEKVEVLDLDDYERAGMLVDYSAPFNKQNSKTKYTNEIFIHMKENCLVYMRRIIHLPRRSY